MNAATTALGRQPGKGAPPPHLRDKNKQPFRSRRERLGADAGGRRSPSKQANGDESDFQPYDDLDTTIQ